MISVGEAREVARKRLQTKRAMWATGAAGAWTTADSASGPDAVSPVLVIALKPPSEREMLADERAAERWAGEWSEVEAGDVEWEVRAWHSIGRQRVPVRLTLRFPGDVALFVGGEMLRQWRRLDERATRLRAAVADARPKLPPGPVVVAAPEARLDPVALEAAIRRYAEQLLRYGEQEFTDVVAATVWLIENSVHGLRPRQLPIRGVDTKWFAGHRGILTALHRAATGHESLGIVDADPLVRVRILDPELAIGFITELAAPASTLAELEYLPRVVFVFENLESVLAMPDWPGAIAVHGSGYAVDVVGSLPWVRDAPVIYWGDLDSNGFGILHRLRSRHPDVTSVLMDEETLLAYPDLWVREPTPNRGVFDTLTASEQRALQRLRDEGDVRLEQERIPWRDAEVTLWRAVFG